VPALFGEIKISNSLFEQNYSGQRGSAINLKDIQSSKVHLRNNIFKNNTGSFSFLEREHLLPFFEILAMKQHFLNYFTHVAHTTCADEIVSVGRPDCFVQQYNTAASADLEKPNNLEDHMLHLQYPHMKGAIYMNGINTTKIENCTFTENDAGPILNDLQIVGMVEHEHQKNTRRTVERASAIFIEQEASEVQITNCLFHDNSLDFLKDFVKNNNRDLYEFFPPDYFSSAHSP
jgi:hypothetical protein